MQQKNLVLFIALCLLILVGWPMLMNQFTQKPQRKEGEHNAKRMPPEGMRDLLALGAVPSPAVPGVANAMGALGAKAASLPRPLSPELAWLRLTREQRDNLRILGGALAASAPNFNSSDLYNMSLVQALVQAKPGPEPERYLLGGGKEDFLTAVLTTRGAGVQKLILNKFEAATREGRPAGHELALIQDDPVLASFLMYHYPQVDKEDARPVDTLGRELWKYEGGDSSRRVFSTRLKMPDGGALLITKIYRLEPRTYHITLQLQLEYKVRPGSKAPPLKFRYQFAGPHGMPIEGEWFTSTFRNLMIGMVDARNNLWRELDDNQNRISFRKGGDKVPPLGLPPGSYIQYAGVAIQYFASLIVVDDKQPPPNEGGVDFKRIVSYVRPTLETEEKRGQIKSIHSVGDLTIVVLRSLEKDGGDFKVELLPRARERLEKDKLEPGTDVVVNSYEAAGKLVGADIRKGRSLRPYTEDITTRAVSEVELPPGQKVVHQFMLYNGPVKVRLLSQFRGDKAVDAALVARYAVDLHLDTLTDYRSAGVPGAIAQKIFWTDLLIQCTRLMHWLLDKLHFVVRDYGLSIIFLTVLVRGLMFPISRRQAYLSIRMQELAPEMKRLQEKYKNDPQAKNQAVMELYRRHKVNPMGGCLPLLLQMPIFLGLYYALQESIHFRLAPFVWIENLAAPDMLWRWGENIPIPIISAISNPDNQGAIYYLGPFFNLLPVIAVVFMVMQQKMLTPPPQDEQQAFQQKLMKYMMVFFGVMFYKVAAGLCLYFIVSSLWGLAERKLLPKRPLPGLAGAGGVPPPKKVEARRSVAGVAPAAAGRGKGRSGRKERPVEVEGPVQKVKDWWAEVLKQARKR